MSSVDLKNLGFQRKQPEDREGLSRIRIPGIGHLGNSERYGSSSSAPPTPQRFISMEYKQQEVQLGASFQKICLKDIDFKDLMVITKGWNLTIKFRLLEVRANRIRGNQATIQAIEEQLTQTGHTQIPSGSQGAGQISSSVASHHSETKRSVAKSHHSSQSQEVSKRRQ
ncbi:hypothetical protein O181_083323 [Austropuccinia psidii MF-1]|uniref:Uncharacterized protein n=1 Tax=Austropuccinia psidii MF-1 TaxID=1389203 RepID=A0A9Q3IJF9_9BASI|nr:hypothetical protein [Austropuccinia psidii MF-1]